VNGLVDVKQKNISLFGEPLGRQINQSSTIDEEEKFDFLVRFALLYFLVELGIG